MKKVFAAALTLSITACSLYAQDSSLLKDVDPGRPKKEYVTNAFKSSRVINGHSMLVDAQLVGQDGKSYKSDYTEGIGKTTYFTDDRGVTLYTFKLDSLNKNKFTKPDFSNNNVWPIYETDKVVVPSILDKTKFGSINVFGRTQLTYKGWPLYYFGQDDQTRGFNKGISFANPGT